MNTVRRVAQVYVLACLVLWLVPLVVFERIRPDQIGVCQSNFSGVIEEDLGPG